MLSYPKRIAYGMGRAGSSLILTFIDFSSLNVYYAYFLVNPLFVGLANVVGFLVIGLSHWLMGYQSDRTETRFGRRRPYLMIGSPAIAIFGFLIFVPQWFIPASPNPINDPSWQLLNFGYYMGMLALFKFFWAFLMTAYQAWLPEIAEPDERPNVAAVQNTANWIGDGIGIVLGFIPSIMFIAGLGFLTPLGFGILFTICALAFLLFLPAMLYIRERPGITPPRRSIVRETKTILKNRTYLKWIMIVGFYSATLAVTTKIIVPMLEHGFALSIMELVSIAGIFIIGILVLFYVWAMLVPRIGKRRTLTLGLVILAILLPFTIVIGSPMLGPAIIQLVIWAIPFAASMAAIYLMRYVVLADIAHKDELESGEGRAGIYEGFQGVPLNIFQAFGVGLLGWLLLILQVSPPPDPINLAFFWWGPIYTIFIIMSIIILQFTDIDPVFESQEKGS